MNKHIVMFIAAALASLLGACVSTPDGHVSLDVDTAYKMSKASYCMLSEEERMKIRAKFGNTVVVDCNQ